jgi:hypothetical protein
MFNAWAVVLYQHISGLNHTLEHSDTFRFLQVEGQAAFVAMQVLKVRSVTGVTVLDRHTRWGFDLNHVRAPICELAGAGGPCARSGQV